MYHQKYFQAIRTLVSSCIYETLPGEWAGVMRKRITNFKCHLKGQLVLSSLCQLITTLILYCGWLHRVDVGRFGWTYCFHLQCQAEDGGIRPQRENYYILRRIFYSLQLLSLLRAKYYIHYCFLKAIGLRARLEKELDQVLHPNKTTCTIIQFHILTFAFLYRTRVSEVNVSKLISHKLN